jgi:hypothetical protein
MSIRTHGCRRRCEQYQLTTLLDQIKQVSEQAVQLLAALSTNLAAQAWLDKKQLRSEVFAQAGNAKASIAELRTAVVNQDTAFAQFETQVSASFGDVFSSVNTVTSAVAQLNGFAAASWGTTVNVNHHVIGIQLVNGGQSAGSFTVTADTFQVAFPAANGSSGNPTPVFTIGTIAGQPTIGINGNLILSGTITASMMNVGSLSAISVNAGDIKAGTLSDPNSARMMIDLNNGFIDIFDNSGSSFAAVDDDDDHDDIDLSDPS